ncbi:hypothetical protein Ctob_006464, partial [Chrysochromulina tobinii]
MREDGRTLRLFRGGRRLYSPPLGSPTFFAGSPPTSAGALPPEFIIGSRRTLS